VPLRRAVVAWVVSAAALFAGGWWAAGATSQPPTVPATTLPTILYTVEDGTVERVVTYSASASWPSAPVGVNGLSGTLTSIEVTPGSIVDAGTVLYTVDLRPVVAAVGTVPAFRNLGEGATGADVEQLERFLIGRELLSGTPDTRFSAATSEAVRRWQREVGVPQDGVVRRGDLVFLPILPTAMFLDPEVTVGSSIEGGRSAVRAVTGSPTFTITLSRDQADLVPLSSPVRVRYGSGDTDVWDGVVDSTIAVPPSEVSLTLTAPDGGSLCAETCSAVVPVGQTSLYTADLLVVPTTEGPTVPTAAIATWADGRTVVRLADGTVQPVDVLASADGRSVVSGLEVGDRIQVLQDSP
jgi:peptidoglycan hydrolase-like protein with peptidoglycan-binding domain